MKRVILMLFMSVYLLGNTHVDIPLKYIEIKEKEGQSFFSEMIDIGISELQFEKVDDEYRVVMNYVWEYKDEYDKLIIDSHELDREILSVFFHEISGDDLREIFLITKYEEEYRIFVYGIAFDRWSFYFNSLEYLASVLNENLANVDDLNASMVRKELNNIIEIPVDLGSLSFFDLDELKDIDFFSKDKAILFDSEDEIVTDIAEAEYYIRSFGNGRYGRFEDIGGYHMVEVFEGKEVGEKPYIIKEGKASYYDGYFSAHGTYVNNKKDGDWEESERMYLAYGRYKEDKKVGKWWISNMIGYFVDGLRDGIWINEEGTYVEVYDKGVLVDSYNK